MSMTSVFPPSFGTGLYQKEMIANLRGMPFGVKSLEKLAE